MSSIIQQSPYLRVQRNFPPDNMQALTVEIDRAYCDTATKVNSRTIGIFAQNKPLVTGERWFFDALSAEQTTNAQQQQTLRQIYTFTAAGSIPHGITMNGIFQFSKIYGTFTDGTNSYPLPYVDVVSATNQVNVIVTPTNIVITAGGGAPPAITSGFVVLEWLSLV